MQSGNARLTFVKLIRWRVDMRARVTYSKSDAIRFTGHLDLQRVWERTFRRSHLPVSYSKGFNPQARIQIASALPLGFTSTCEVMDFWLDRTVNAQEIEQALKDSVPPGIRISNIEVVDDHLPPLQTQVVSNEYQVTLLENGNQVEISGRIHDFMAAPSVLRVRRNKTYDLRSLVEEIELRTGSPETTVIWMRMAARQGATGRPEEMLAALDLQPEVARYERIKMIMANSL